MATPCILLTSCSEYDPENIVKDILKVDSLPHGTHVLEDILSYDWSIDTKYYTADVRLCTTKQRTIGDQSFADAVQAFIVYFDPTQKSTFDSVKSWTSYLDQIDPDVKMLVCDRCAENSDVSRLDAQKWCIENGFELVELNAETESDSEAEDDFLETTGLPRIVQSLHAHTWPNLQLKENPKTVSPYIRQLMKEEFESRERETDAAADGNAVTADCDIDGTSDTNCTCGDADSTHSAAQSGSGERNSDNKQIQGCINDEQLEKDLRKAATGDDLLQHAPKATASGDKKKPLPVSKAERIDSLLPAEDMALFEALGSEDPNGESFEKLFEQFASMKDKASNLPPEERKKYAENVAIAFWKAMGGDEDEIGDLDDSD